MVEGVELVLTIIQLIFSISLVAYGVYGIAYRIYISTKYSVKFLYVDMPGWYEIAFWIIVFPFLIIGAILMLM
jgi:hypothetical protein